MDRSEAGDLEVEVEDDDEPNADKSRLAKLEADTMVSIILGLGTDWKLIYLATSALI